MATALPAAGYFSDIARINSEAKTAQDAILAWLRQSSLGAAGAPSTLTLATDAITPTGAVHLVDTEGAASTDNLSTINITNTVDGQLLLLTGANAAHLVTVVHAIGGTGQILLQDDTAAVLDDENHILLRRSGNNWIEVARSHGADQVFWCGTAGGTANALTFSPNIAIPAYRTGMTFIVIAGLASTSGTVTANAQSLGAKNIKKIRGTGKVALGTTDIIAGTPMILVYDGTDLIYANAPNESMGADVASSGTVVLNNATGLYFNITGTTNITALTLAQGQRAIVKFGGILTLTNGASLINLSGANISTAAGDVAEFVGEASGVVRMLRYEKADGTPLVGSVIGKQTIWVPAGAMIARTTNGPSTGTVETGTNKNMIKTLDFDTTTQEFAQFEVFMPKSWNLGTVTFIAVWSHAATTTNFGVAWALQGVARSDDDAQDVAFGTEQVVTDTGGTTDDLYITSESSAITIGGTPAAGDSVLFQVKRVPANGSDTMAIDARLQGVKILYTVNAGNDT